MKHILTISYLFVFLTLLGVPQAHAQERASGSSATLMAQQTTIVADTRAQALSAYLQAHNSPLTPFAKNFVSEADTYGLPWDLLAAISGTESTLGQQVPCINAWGWGIYGTNMLCFTSYPEAIHTISKEIRERYINQWGDDDIYKLGRHYAASPLWAAHTEYWMRDIEAFKQNFDAKQLTLSI